MPARPRRLHATHRHPRSEHYRRPGGPWDVPPLDTLLSAATHGNDDLIVDGTTRLHGDEIAAKVSSLAGGLRGLGVRRGDVVTWQTPNWHEAVLLFRACWRLGAIAAPLHHRVGAGEVAPLLEILEPRVTLAAEHLPLASHPGTLPIRGDSDAFTNLLQARPIATDAARPSDVAVVLFTSGSTGTPKAVLHTHRGLAYKAKIQPPAHGLVPGDAVLMPAPLAHVSGLLNGVVMPGATPMKVVLMEAWDPDDALQLIEREGISYMGGPAAFLTSLVGAQGFTPERVTSLRVASMGGSSMSPSSILRLGEALGCTVKRTYGSTEMPTVTTLHHGDPPEHGSETDGRAVGECEVRIVDPAGKNVPAGEPGEVWLRGPEQFAGYADADETRAAMARGGWFRTGDLGRLDGSWLTIVGRIKELIIRGGENIASAEVESILEAHPAVTQAVAVGYPDELLGERVAAVVVAPEGFDLDTCRAWFADRGVARFKTPELVICIGEIPLLPTGKPDRSALRDIASRQTSSSNR